ncbi:endonuclease/exonuclease/phosphatase family protein [Patescibacteria group bacterium]|nr:endonuclease/exonuclease/phosphatase family protein [Patescibacteria group bacterium]
MAPENSIRFSSINIEGDKHLKEAAAFLCAFNPEVVCFQELNESSVSFFEKILGMKGCFVPMSRHLALPKKIHTAFGVGIFSNLPLSAAHFEYYYGGTGELPTLKIGDEATVWRPLLFGTVEKEGISYTIAVTHFTRTPDGNADEKQRTDMKKLLGFLGRMPGFILCGDFNAPRGGEIFSMLAEKYQDNIPREYLSSLDPTLHKLKDGKQLMVDGLFMTTGYQAHEVKLTEGVSDHKAVTALISKRE